MKTREQIYGQEAASILRDVAMYKALTEEQLLRLYPQKESKVKNLLAYLVRQGRLHRSGGYFCVDSEQVEHIDRGMMSAVWVLLDFIEQAEFHSVGEYPAKIIFLAGGEVYESSMWKRGKRRWSINCCPKRRRKPQSILSWLTSRTRSRSSTSPIPADTVPFPGREQSNTIK